MTYQIQHWHPKKVKLFAILGALFIGHALLAEFIGVKIFSLEKTFGFNPLNFEWFGIPNLSFNLTAGVILWPFVFIATDIINEYFGKKGVQLMSFLAAGIIAYSFLMVYFAIKSVPADFWVNRETTHGIIQMQWAFEAVYGQGLWIIVGSLVAFLIGQLLDVFVFQQLKRFTGERLLWLRATGSTVVSQLIDSFVVLFIAFYLGADWSLQLVTTIALVNYTYKFGAAVLLTPLIYVAHLLIERYLGTDLAAQMKADAVNGK